MFSYIAIHYTSNSGRDLLCRFKELKTTERSDTLNPGLTIVEI
jgi:hypothetical protein